MLIRPQWPHNVDDIVKALDKVWGVVGATNDAGQLFRLEKSLQPPITYTLIEYEGGEESKVLSQRVFPEEERAQAIRTFATLLGFSQ